MVEIISQTEKIMVFRIRKIKRMTTLTSRPCKEVSLNMGLKILRIQTLRPVNWRPVFRWRTKRLAAVMRPWEYHQAGKVMMSRMISVARYLIVVMRVDMG